MALEREMSTPPIPSRSVAHFTFTDSVAIDDRDSRLVKQWLLGKHYIGYQLRRGKRKTEDYMERQKDISQMNAVWDGISKQQWTDWSGE